MKIEIFKNEKAKVEQDLKSIKRKSDLISWIRVALFILMVVFLTYGYFNKNNKFYLLVLISALVFLILVKYHSNIEADVKYKQVKWDLVRF